ncbi:MAG: hypothetical protein CK604_06060 [Curvibacter sp. PD_MW3]|nr:MAG: hypothetical protein CK604_06060 [Curvibacter sp. PD_MW3]
MRSFLFEDIWILSRKDKRARIVDFNPGKNLILGRNHTGKSSLIKSLFTTLGATPSGKLQGWNEDTITKVGFSVDGIRYAALHQAGTRALFDAEGQTLTVAQNQSAWSEAFAAATGFNLPLIDKNSKTVLADPRCFFMPFYINQDGSWMAEWDTFTGIQQYKAPILSILEYFTGIKPPEYYAAKAKRDAEQVIIEELRREKASLEKARERVSKSLSMSGPKVDPKNFETEIAQLTTEINELNQKQEILRDQAVKERELLSSIRLQNRLAEEALKVYESDAEFIRSEPRDAIVCPVCNAEHENSFLDLLTYAEDARSLRDITVRLRRDSIEVEARLAKTQGQIDELAAHYRKVSELLGTRRGEMQFTQVVDSLGAERAFSAFEQERAVLEKELGERLLTQERLSEGMEKLTDRARSKDILKTFREAFSSALIALNLPANDTSKARLNSRPNVSGSGGPRSVLAYYAALWAACYGQMGSFQVPLVVDSPNQQGQDDINLPKIIQFICERLPQRAQLILGSEIDTEHDFDQKHELSDQYRLLNSASFDDVEKVLGPMATLMYLKA